MSSFITCYIFSLFSSRWAWIFVEHDIFFIRVSIHSTQFIRVSCLNSLNSPTLAVAYVSAVYYIWSKNGKLEKNTKNARLKPNNNTNNTNIFESMEKNTYTGWILNKCIRAKGWLLPWWRSIFAKTLFCISF